MIALTPDILPGISDQVYGDRDFRAVRDLVHADAGIVLPAGKAMLVYSRLAPLVRRTNSATFARYIELLEADAVERRQAVAALTTNHTFFFREQHHFDHLRDVVRPRLLQRLERGERVRIWSAGCSSGEECWSIAATLLGTDRAAGQRLASYDLAILATDLADHALRTAARATYPLDAVSGIPDHYRRLWFEETDGGLQAGSELRSLVRFRCLNLQHDWPFRGRFDAIFCRNVMIYFDQPTNERLMARLADRLTTDGTLFIGHSERATGKAARQLVQVGPTIFQRRTA